MKIKNGKVSEFRNPSNFCNGNTLDNEENLIRQWIEEGAIE